MVATIEGLKYINENGQEVIIMVSLDCLWGNSFYGISDIYYKRNKRAKEYTSLKSEWMGNIEYKYLETDKKNAYDLKRFIEFAGMENLKKAISVAWENLKPNFDTVVENNSVYLVRATYQAEPSREIYYD